MTQFTVVLRHLRVLRPEWQVDVRCGKGKHTALIGLCRAVYHDQQDHPPRERYKQYVDLSWFENYNRYGDRPNSKVTNCLHEVFGLPWLPHLGSYEIAVGPPHLLRARHFLTACGATEDEAGRFNVVILHYEGNTSPSKKNLGHWQARALIDTVIANGKIPVLLDWDRRSPLPDQKTVFNPGCGDNDIWGGFGSGDAATIAAMVRLSQAFIGIDSGPGKVASSTDTPVLICWRGHHPVQFHDPALTTTHLVPAGWRSLSPCDNEKAVQDFFERHYKYRAYDGEHGLVGEAVRWLEAALGRTAESRQPALKFATPNGIGDVMWALTKMRHVAAGRPIAVVLSGDPRKALDHRTVPFLKRFPFVGGVEVLDVPMLHDKDNPSDSRGRYNYVSDGPRGDYHYLVPNRTLESGRRLEQWLPEVPTDWDVIDTFDWQNTERGDALGKGLAPFVAVYLGPEAGHTDEGHNRGWLWEPKHWVELGLAFKGRGLHVAVVGADYDRSFWDKYVRDGATRAGLNWVDLTGTMEIGETFAFLKRAKCLVSYQCGLGIVGHYLGVNVAMWWRPEGDSAHPRHLISFDERMATAWVRPGREGSYMGLIYKRESPGQIIAEMDRRGWLS